ncbi:hypothetical protein QUF55_04960 [Clostridiaceae bacterium HSG29]|nr:hypothetical protein [Clostridiaceae bacterium HSG29]
MNEILKEILKTNKLIKVLIKEEKIDALKEELSRKNKLIKLYGKERNKNNANDKEIFKSINELDNENMKNFKLLMNKTKSLVDEIKNQKGEIKNKNSKMKKYKTNNNISGYRFDRKK